MKTEENIVKEKRRLDAETWRLNNPIKNKAKTDKWVNNNRHRTQALTHQNDVRRRYPEEYATTNITVDDLSSFILAKKNKDVCSFCSNTVQHVDHIVPLSKGGKHVWSNIRMICEFCNRAKHDKTEEEFIQWIQGLVKKHTT